MPTLTRPLPNRMPAARTSGERQGARTSDEDSPSVRVPGPSLSWLNPNALRRSVPITALAAGSAAVVLAFGGPLDGPLKSISEAVYNLWHGAQVENALKRPYAQVAGDVDSGEIGSGDFVTVRAPKTESAWQEATDLTGGDHPVQPVVDIIAAQQGDHVVEGEPAILPAGSIDDPS